MTANIMIGILVAAIAVVLISLTTFILMLRDYARKYRKTLEVRSKAEAPLTFSMVTSPTLGVTVKFHDTSGMVHDALVTAVHNARMVNLVIVSSDETKTDGYGRELERATSVPYKEATLSDRYYFRFFDDEPNAHETGVPSHVMAEKRERVVGHA